MFNFILLAFCLFLEHNKGLQCPQLLGNAGAMLF